MSEAEESAYQKVCRDRMYDLAESCGEYGRAYYISKGKDGKQGISDDRTEMIGWGEDGKYTLVIIEAPHCDVAIEDYNFMANIETDPMIVKKLNNKFLESVEVITHPGCLEHKLHAEAYVDRISRTIKEFDRSKLKIYRYDVSGIVTPIADV